MASTKEMSPISRKSISKLIVIQPSFRVVGQTHAEWQRFKQPENKRQIFGSALATIHLSLTFGFFKCLPQDICVMTSFDYNYQNAFRCSLCYADSVTHERFFIKEKILNTIACPKAFFW